VIARFVLLLLTLGVINGQETSQDLETYGPWRGRWVKARLSAYSPHDALDKEYHASKGERWRWICADGKTDVRNEPYGLAAPDSLRFGTRIFIPTGHGYLDTGRPSPNERVFVVSDRGGFIQRWKSPDGSIALDVRFRTEYSALAFGVKDAWVFVITEVK
jgi:hypothetical protein